MKLRLSVTSGWKPLFFCRGAKGGRQCSTEADHDNDRHPNLVCHGMPRSSQGIPSSNISITTSDKVTRGDMSNLRQRSGQKWPHLSNNDQLVERGCPSPLLCHVNLASKSIITSSEMKKLVVKKGTQSNVSAKSVPSWVPPQFLAGQDFLSNGTQCTQKNRKTFWKEKSKKDD